MACREKPFMHEVIEGKVCIAQNLSGFSNAKKFRCFQPQTVLRYQPFCDDFGPMNLAAVTRFIEMLDSEITSHPSCKIVYCVEEGRRALTNAAFLLGAYMILKLNITATTVLESFSWLDRTLIEAYRDATYSQPTFGLTLLDCWAGLERGKVNGWVAMPSRPGTWGDTDVDEYEHYDEPGNGDLHRVVPAKFVAFRGPVDLGDLDYRDTNGYRQFSPRCYVDLFRDMGVSTVIRLNEPEYDEADFSSQGIRHHDLHFPDCTAPPAHVVERFMRIVSSAPGAVAVHCKAGLGRTGTLIAVYLMRTHGFTAREAMGWLRIMRPGSVIGEQQHFLIDLEAAAAAPSARAAARLRLRRSADCAAALAAQVSAAMERRAGGCAAPEPRAAAASSAARSALVDVCDRRGAMEWHDGMRSASDQPVACVLESDGGR